MSARAAPRSLSLTLAWLWCVMFAGVHVYWALGGDAGLAESAGVELAATRPTWFIAVGLWGVAFLLLGAAAVALHLVRARRRGRPSGWPLRRWRPAFWIVAVVGVLLLARGLVLELVLLLDLGGVASAVGPAQTHWSVLLWNPWFALGGAAFLIAFLDVRSTTRATSTHRGESPPSI